MSDRQSVGDVVLISDAQTRDEPANGLVIASLVGAITMTGLMSWDGRHWSLLSVVMTVVICGLPWLASVLLIYRARRTAAAVHVLYGCGWVMFGFFTFALFVPLIGMCFIVLGAVELFE